MVEKGAKVQLAPSIGEYTFYLDAFRELSTCRPSGMGVSRIPFTAIADYARIYDVDDFEDFKEIIRILDEKVLSLNAKSKEDDGRDKKHNHKSKGRR